MLPTSPSHALSPAAAAAAKTQMSRRANIPAVTTLTSLPPDVLGPLLLSVEQYPGYRPHLVHPACRSALEQCRQEHLTQWLLSRGTVEQALCRLASSTHAQREAVAGSLLEHHLPSAAASRTPLLQRVLGVAARKGAAWLFGQVLHQLPEELRHDSVLHAVDSAEGITPPAVCLSLLQHVHQCALPVWQGLGLNISCDQAQQQGQTDMLCNLLRCCGAEERSSVVLPYACTAFANNNWQQLQALLATLPDQLPAACLATPSCMAAPHSPHSWEHFVSNEIAEGRLEDVVHHVLRSLLPKAHPDDAASLVQVVLICTRDEDVGAAVDVLMGLVPQDRLGEVAQVGALGAAACHKPRLAMHLLQHHVAVSNSSSPALLTQLSRRMCIVAALDAGSLSSMDGDCITTIVAWALQQGLDWHRHLPAVLCAAVRGGKPNACRALLALGVPVSGVLIQHPSDSNPDYEGGPVTAEAEEESLVPYNAVQLTVERALGSKSSDQGGAAAPMQTTTSDILGMLLAAPMQPAVYKAALEYAIRSPHPQQLEVVKLLVQHVACLGPHEAVSAALSTALKQAVSAGQVEVGGVLVAGGAGVTDVEALVHLTTAPAVTRAMQASWATLLARTLPPSQQEQALAAAIAHRAPHLCSALVELGVRVSAGQLMAAEVAVAAAAAEEGGAGGDALLMTAVLVKGAAQGVMRSAACGTLARDPATQALLGAVADTQVHGAATGALLCTVGPQGLTPDSVCAAECKVLLAEQGAVATACGSLALVLAACRGLPETCALLLQYGAVLSVLHQPLCLALEAAGVPLQTSYYSGLSSSLGGQHPPGLAVGADRCSTSHTGVGVDVGVPQAVSVLQAMLRAHVLTASQESSVRSVLVAVTAGVVGTRDIILPDTSRRSQAGDKGNHSIKRSSSPNADDSFAGCRRPRKATPGSSAKRWRKQRSAQKSLLYFVAGVGFGVGLKFGVDKAEVVRQSVSRRLCALLVPVLAKKNT